MRTKIVIDDALMRQAMQASGALSKRVAVVLVLSTLVRLQQQGDIRASRSSLAAVVAQSESPRFIPAQPQWVSSSPGLSASLNAPADCLSPFPCVGTLQQQLIFAITQAGTSGKLQSKRIFNAVDMLVQIADRLQVDYRRFSIVEYLYLFNGPIEVHAHKVFPTVAV